MINARLISALAALSFACAALAQLSRPIRLGESLPPLEVDYVKGDSIDAPNGHNITVVEFWATWCAPCRMTIPHLSELQARYGDRGFQVVGISDEPPETVVPFVKQMADQMNYRVAVDRDGQTTLRFRDPEDGIPRAFLFNELGALVWIGHPADNDLEQLIKELTDELNKNS